MPDPALTTQLIAELTRIIRARIEGDRLILPAMPQVARRCLTLLEDPGVAMRKLVLVLETDPLFAAQVMRAASTAAFGGQPARSLDMAVSRLGLDPLRVVVTQAAARSLFTTKNRDIATRLQQLWKHSIAVAIMAGDIAALMKAPDPANTYLTGLLHDVGKTVVATLLVEAEASLGKTSWIDADQWSRVVGATHRPIGVALAERWNLAPDVVAAVRDCAEYDAKQRQCTANVVRFANALVKTHGVPGGHVDSDETAALVTVGRAMLDLDEADVEHLIQQLGERVDGALAA